MKRTIFCGMVGQIQVHYPAPQLGQTARLCGDFHAVFRRSGAGGRGTFFSLNLHQTQAAGTIALQTIGGTEGRNIRIHRGRRPHEAGAIRDRDRLAINFQRNRIFRANVRRAVIFFRDHDFAPKSLGHFCRALKTGIGVMPPMAQSEPDSITSQSSFIRGIFSASPA